MKAIIGAALALSLSASMAVAQHHHYGMTPHYNPMPFRYGIMPPPPVEYFYNSFEAPRCRREVAEYRWNGYQWLPVFRNRCY